MKLGSKTPGVAATRVDKIAGRRRRLATPVALAALIAFFSLGVAAPTATAAEPNTKAVYTLNVNGQAVTLTEGQSVVYGMQRINSPAALGHVSPNVTYPGDAGTLTVTASAGVYHYSVAMSIPATNFVGAFSTTDVTSGLSGGSVVELVFAGSVPTSKLHGHRYSGTLTGEAFFLGAPVATTVPNNTLYTYP
jgi:hypothetical protein